MAKNVINQATAAKIRLAITDRQLRKTLTNVNPSEIATFACQTARNFRGLQKYVHGIGVDYPPEIWKKIKELMERINKIPKSRAL